MEPRFREMLFISYSRKNKEQVYPFVDALSKAGVDVWIDRGIEPLDIFRHAFEKGWRAAMVCWRGIRRITRVRSIAKGTDGGVD